MRILQNKIIRYSLLVVFVTLTFAACESRESVNAPWRDNDGYIPDEETAKQVAEVIWTRIYGGSISNNKPFKVSLKDSTIWIVEGSINPNTIGGTPYAEIQKADGKILKITHTK
jgi:hypothetical protein